MDWLRRNWPDLLIGIALIAVIAGIVATLLTGGSFFPINPGQTGTPISTPNVQPVAPDVGRAPDGGVVTPGTPANGASGGDGAGTPSAGARTEQPTGNVGAIAILPPAGETPAPSTPEAEAGNGASPAAGSSRPASDAGPAPAASNAAGSAASGGAQSAGAAAPTAPYRVSVGAFSSEANAQRQADVFREAGFPVFLGRQGDLVLTLVGPYDTEQEAQQAVSRIRSGDFGIEPVIYRFQPDEGAPAADGPTAPSASQSGAADSADAEADAAPAEAAPEADAAPAPTPSEAASGAFLQVGAYANRESAQPQIDRLQALGFETVERLESGLVKLLVGPFDADELPDARSRLQAEGIEHFVR